MRGGNRSKPVSEHLKAGTYNVTRHKDRASDSYEKLGAIPKPPAYFTKGQIEKWNTLCGYLYTDGMLCGQFLEGVERYCNAWQTWSEAVQNVRKIGITFTTKAGQIRQNPAVNIEKEMLALMLRILNEFGYTPRSSMSLKITGGTDKELDPLAAIKQN